MQRWDLEEYYAPEAAGGLTMSVRLGAFVPDLDGFDAALFRCAPAAPSGHDLQSMAHGSE